ncbi:hypothetical protein B7P43_G09601 [Cryptotermes secundus]|uniref:RNA helicase n=1 Tax=Cryptotermes secundus TaxID=105785 RepID=A0A2J7PS79_9NEOP|nr:hypothetical protein B7P43_G09601 [Cryptotermes secundus]
MQLRFGLCELCRSTLFSPPTRIASVAEFHNHPALLANARVAVKVGALGSEVDSSEQRKKVLRISCKRSEYNLYEGQTYGKFESIPLASKGWHHRKSRGDFFTIQKYRENPAICNSSESGISFSDTGLSSNIIDILEEQEITEPTVIQKDGIPTILEGRNTLLTAETGCGKTLAYLLPMINQILMWRLVLSEHRFNSPLGVIVSPNRELANQIGEIAETFSRKLMFTSKVLTGGHTKSKIMNPSFEEVDLLVASLGALSKLTTTGIYNMKSVHHVVLDEADTLLDDSFSEKLCRFLRHFQFQFRTATSTLTAVPAGAQMTLVSAVVPTSLTDILSPVIQTDSLVRVTTSQVHRLLPHVPQKFYRLGRSHKPGQLLAMVKSDTAKKHPVIIFSNKSSTCDWISMFLNENGVKCVNLNGKMPLDIRTGKLRLFQSGDVNVISCTDIGSRGINTVRVSEGSLEQNII